MAVDKTTLMSKKLWNLYAVGCSDCGEMVNIPKIAGQAATVAKNLKHTINGEPPQIKHTEMASWYSAEGFIPHGNWGMVSQDGLGPLCPCAFLCGFPFPCLCAPCVPACGICGTSCRRPVGAYMGPGAFWDYAIHLGLAGPIMNVVDKKRVEGVPIGNPMKRD